MDAKIQLAIDDILGCAENWIADDDNKDAEWPAGYELAIAQMRAAPDLLAALELMLDKDAAMTERFGDRWPLDLAPVHAVNAARAAIAKAGQ
jgi:hypothetical protein